MLGGGCEKKLTIDLIEYGLLYPVKNTQSNLFASSMLKNPDLIPFDIMGHVLAFPRRGKNIYGVNLFVLRKVFDT
jgi:hypothetical protein